MATTYHQHLKKRLGYLDQNIIKDLEGCAERLMKDANHLHEANIILGVVGILQHVRIVEDTEEGILRDLHKYYDKKLRGLDISEKRESGFDHDAQNRKRS
jgi:hypothetical protein